jgi:ATP-binding cassette, subfamily B, bacterial PglK
MTFSEKLRTLLTKRDKGILGIILIATIFVSLLEVANISLTMLFITLITNFKSLETQKHYLLVQKHLPFEITPPLLLLLFGSFLILFFLFRCAATFLYTYKLNLFSQNRSHRFAFRFFKNYLHFNYKQITTKNPSLVNKLIFADATGLTTVISTALTTLSEVFTIILIYGSLVFINWKMTIVLSFLLSIKVAFLLKIFSKRLANEGKKVGKLSSQITKVFLESFRNFKFIKLLSGESLILKRFEEKNKELINANVMNATLQTTPRIFLETIGFTMLVGTVMYVVYRAETPEFIIPVLSMYALAFYRFMPSVNKLIAGYNQIIFSKNMIDQSSELMYKPETYGTDRLSFDSLIEFRNASFEYEAGKKILDTCSLKIQKGESVAFIGESGAGKSTLADMLMGFFHPISGTIHIDGVPLTNQNRKSWMAKIGYIPQQIYLFDGTVSENILCGRSRNEEKLIEVLTKANLYTFLQTKEGLETKVGEGGIQLSGGQMQRVAIARALYSDPEIFVLDEATSALDNSTENQIMNEIYKLHESTKTLIVIAHRLSTVLKCEKVYKVDAQKIIPISKDDLYIEYANSVQQPQSQKMVQS